MCAARRQRRLTGPLEVLAAAAAEAEAAMKQADEDFAAADKADNEARHGTLDAKQAEKDTDAAFKSATKAVIDAKADETKIAANLKKLQASVEAVQRKIQDFSSSMSTLSSSRSKVNTLDKNNEEKKARFDKASEGLAREMAKMEEWKQQVEHCKSEKLRICNEARAPEMEEIVHGPLLPHCVFVTI